MARGNLNPLVQHVRRVAADTASQTDRQLLERYLAERDPTAFAALMRRHSRLVLSACRRVLSDEVDIEDAFQATFLVLVHKAATVRWQASIGCWLYSVAHRVAVQARGGKARRQRHEGRASTRRPEAVEPADPSWREACAVLHEELNRLPDRFRLPLLLCYLEGKSREEAASELGCSAGSVKGNLERGRQRLHTRLKRRGITLSAGLLAAVVAPRASAVPPQLVNSTLETVLETAALPAVGGAASVRAVLLAQGVLQSMRTTRRITATLAALVVIAAGSGIGLMAGHSPTGAPAQPPAPAQRQPEPAAQPALAEAITVRGRVLAPDGKPVADARLFTYRRPAGSPASDYTLVLVEGGRTGADGRFQFDAPKTPVYPPGDQTHLIPVVAVADGYGFARANQSRPDEELTIPLVSDQPIMGRVLDAEGRPVAGAKVRVEAVLDTANGRLDAYLQVWKSNWRDARPPSGIGQPPATVVPVTATDRDGRFRITGAGAERVLQLEVTGPGIAQSRIDVVTRTGFDAQPINRAAAEREPELMRQLPGYLPLLYGPSFDFVATPAKPVEGTVREAGSGRPVAGARVTNSVAYSSSVAATTDTSGHFRLDGIPKRKEYSLHVSPREGSPLIGRSVRLADSEGLVPLAADVELVRGVVITGRVIDRATGRAVFSDLHYIPLPNNPYYEKPSYAPYRQDRFGTSTRPDGHFRLTAIPGPGVLTVRAYGDETLNGQRLAPYPLADVSEEDRKLLRLTERDDGSLQIPTASGSTELVSANVLKRLDPAEGGDPVTLDLFVDRGQTTAVQVQDADGQPLTGVIASGLTAMWPITFPLKQAECTVYGLNPKKPRPVVFYHPERKLVATFNARGDEGKPVTVKLVPAGEIKGRVLDAEGQPVAGARVTVVYWSHPGRELERNFRQQRGQAQTDADGRFRLEGVITDLNFDLGFGKGTTHLATMEGKPWFSPHQVKSGQTLDLGEMRTKPFRQ